MRDEDQTHMHPNQILSPTTTQWLGKHHTLVSFAWFLRVNNIEKMYKRDVKYEIALTWIWLLKQSIIINIFNF